MTDAFYLRCMGAPELRSPDGRVVRLRGNKHLALLVFLAVERRTQYRRDELTELLWADMPQSRARHSLATSASAIRRALGPGVLDGNREVLRLRHAAVRVDLERLDSGELFETADLPPIEVDGFLSQFDLRDAPEYIHWRDRQQALWLPKIHAALLRLIDHARRTGASRVIGNLADRLVAIDSLSEEAVRAKMEALAFAGDRIAALRVFEEWRARLEQELGAVPSKLVEEMARRLRRRGLERSVADPVPSVQTDPWRDRPFVGRATEYRTLYEGWESALRGSPRHALVEGESGIGKSTLVERFAMAAALEGAIVARTQCYELEREIPFATIAALITGLVDKPGVSATDPAALAEVARVVPRIRERFAGLPAPRDSQGETARLHFAEGILAMLEAAMEEHPVVLVVDDFHLADEVSLTVLHLLIRRLESARLVVMLTMRTSELEAASGAARIHGGGEYLRMARLVLPPLSEGESSELLAGLVPADQDPPNPPERHALLQAARGIPMVLQLLVQDWQRHGSASLALAIRSMTAQLGPGGHQGAEGAYRHIVERVLGELDPVARLVLHAASVFGSRVSDLSLYQVADLTSSQAMMGIGELTRRRILRDSPTGLDFVNELVRGQVYSVMPGTLRQVLHAAVAQQLLARLASGDSAVRGLETAWHLVRGGHASDAAPHLLRGAHEAIREGAPHEAELALGSALGEPGILGGRSRDDAVLLLAEIQQEQSRWKDSIDSLGQLSISLQVEQLEQAQLLEAIARRNAEYVTDHDLPKVIQRFVALASDATVPKVKATALRAASAIIDQSQTTDVIDQLRELIRAARPVCIGPEEAAELLTADAMLDYQQRYTSLGREKLLRAAELLEGAGVSSSPFVNLFIGLSAFACSDGHYSDALGYASRAYGLATRIDHERLAWRAASNLALAYGRLGNYEAQLSWASKKAKHLGRGAFDQENLVAAWMVGMAKAMMGDSTAIAAFKDYLGSENRNPVPWIRQTQLLVEADLNHILGQRANALRLARQATTGSLSTPHSIRNTGIFARWVTKLAIHDETTTEAEARLQAIGAKHSTLDLLDWAEILMARAALAPKASDKRAQLIQEFLAARDLLPLAVQHQWERLGWTIE